jgi:hypothetical protein
MVVVQNEKKNEFPCQCILIGYLLAGLCNDASIPIFDSSIRERRKLI